MGIPSGLVRIGPDVTGHGSSHGTSNYRDHLSIQMDEVLPSPPRKRKRVLSPKPPASQRPRLTKRLKIGLTPHNSETCSLFFMSIPIMILHQGFSGEPKTDNIPPKKRPVQKNALAGPSTQANASGQSRYSSRISRPTAKKSTTQIQKRAVVSGSDSDSDESFPSNILPKTPNNLKRGKTSPSKGTELESRRNLFQR